jgi:hypothetical protein
MKPKVVAVSVFATLAVSGLLAAPASAEEESRLTICAMASPAGQACGSVLIPSAEMITLSHRIESCLDAAGDWAKVEIEECIAAWGPNGTEMATAARHLRKKRLKKKRHAKARIALAAAEGR